MDLLDKNHHKNPYLKVNKGIKQPASFHPDAQGLLKKSKPQTLEVEDYVDGIKQGNRVILSKAITLIESSLSKHQELAREIVEQCLPYSGKSIRVGITGVPGVGKSTFVEALGKALTANGHKLAVLAIDPSSQRTKGSILGDKTRMADLAVDKNAFIRPSPSAGTLGGVARKTKEIIVLCEAAGFNVIFIETVGVGQSETAVHSMVDFFLLLMLAGAGDELQGIKRGIMEMADAIIINKADGDNIKKAQMARREYENALHLFPATDSGWIPKAGTCSALTKEGITNVWEIIQEYESFTKKNGFFSKKRQGQEIKIMFETVKESLNDSFIDNPAVKTQLSVLKNKVLKGNMSSYKAAKELLDVYFNKNTGFRS
ncbi:MAG: methylmalonyl Co-A mutase-associated GTPase MeaB [Bacteroidetes bacterium]|nr:MAG: methylmalonyl Co-A mutase-associated GTPase MeaB [Bacteroidota bacterium]